LAASGRDAPAHGLRTAARTAETPARASRTDATGALAGTATPAFETSIPGPGLQAGAPAPTVPPLAVTGVASAPAAATQPAASTASTLPYQAHITAPVGTPAFAPALGAQVRMLVHDGIGHARLELNPAEMGPVSVHIALEGQQAHVEFGADLAATRAALQESLPTLAAALQESGITLTGGGVSERQTGSGGNAGQDSGTPGSRAQAFAPAEGAHAGAAMAPPVAAPAVQGGRGRGTVDLYA
ncbi:flagellar hook-length control protein FliK, partial [uncultured Azohydromonas sp.]|uniref:flagellar hook-length control protein FliK n=1 Tax=uncultured Azohydromonas sp. TaxID=487342 RepID=UPI002622A61D